MKMIIKITTNVIRIYLDLNTGENKPMNLNYKLIFLLIL
jgi:hypothetical protein